jgi:hypothetical protein
MGQTIIDLNHIDVVLKGFKGREFATPDFADKFKVTFPDDWRVLVKRYGPGGARGGAFYSPNNYLGLQLMHRCHRDELQFIAWVSAPEGWGNAKVARWKA